MPHFDFVEIGTSDFDTILETASDTDIGLSIDIIKQYLDILPDKSNCIKCNTAISDKNGDIDIYYIPPDKIGKYNLPDWVRGCNTIGKPHPTVLSLLSNLGINQEDIIDHSKVEMVSFENLVHRFDIVGINILKIDTEGHDCVILNNYCDVLDKNPSLRANEIYFESNELISRQDLTDVLRRLFTYGYDLISSDSNTILRLPISSIDLSSDQKKYDRCYIEGYPFGYDINNLPHDNTLESSLKYAESINAHGITYQNGLFTVRKGRYLIRESLDIYSIVV